MFRSFLFVALLSSTIFSAEVFNQPFKFFLKSRPDTSFRDTSLKTKAKQSVAADTKMMKLVSPTVESPVTAPTTVTTPTNAYWEFKPIVQVPALKIIKSNRAGAVLDVEALMSTGGGVTYQRTILKDGKNYAPIAFSAIALFAGNSANVPAINIAFGLTAGFFNQLIQVGGGYDAGAVTSANQRFFGMLSLGINLTSN